MGAVQESQTTSQILKEILKVTYRILLMTFNCAIVFLN